MAKDTNLLQQLKHYFGFDKFKGDQEAIILSLMEGHDTFVLMPTGGGKSLCYQLPSLIMEGTAIVISPLIALMKNQVDVINGMSEDGTVAHYLNSSLNKSAIQQVMDNVRSGKTKLLYVAHSTPLMKLIAYQNGGTTSVRSIAIYVQRSIKLAMLPS